MLEWFSDVMLIINYESTDVVIVIEAEVYCLRQCVGECNWRRESIIIINKVKSVSNFDVSLIELL
jgi:hypothetical protein